MAVVVGPETQFSASLIPCDELEEGDGEEEEEEEVHDLMRDLVEGEERSS